MRFDTEMGILILWFGKKISKFFDRFIIFEHEKKHEDLSYATCTYIFGNFIMKFT